MRVLLIAVVMVGLAGLPGTPGAAAAEPQAEAAPDEEAVTLDVTVETDEVQMVELTFPHRKVTGRLLDETDAMVRVETRTGGAIGYSRATIQEIRRFTVPAHEYYERIGDAFRETAWQAADAPDQFSKAWRAYSRAVEVSEEPQAKERLERKLEALTEERREWQREALRRHELRKAAAEADLRQLERELTEEKLATVRRHQRILEQMHEAIRELQEYSRHTSNLMENMQRHLAEVERDVDALRRRQYNFVSSGVFRDLRDSHHRLERRVARLERELRRN